MILWWIVAAYCPALLECSETFYEPGERAADGLRAADVPLSHVAVYLKSQGWKELLHPFYRVFVSPPRIICIDGSAFELALPRHCATPEDRRVLINMLDTIASLHELALDALLYEIQSCPAAAVALGIITVPDAQAMVAHYQTLYERRIAALQASIARLHPIVG